MADFVNIHDDTTRDRVARALQAHNEADLTDPLPWDKLDDDERQWWLNDADVALAAAVGR